MTRELGDLLTLNIPPATHKVRASLRTSSLYGRIYLCNGKDYLDTDSE